MAICSRSRFARSARATFRCFTEAVKVVREKFHAATPMSIDQALLEMELVGHDFYLFRDDACGHPSVVYRRHGYQYGLIRLIETAGADAARQHSARA